MKRFLVLLITAILLCSAITVYGDENATATIKPLYGFYMSDKKDIADYKDKNWIIENDLARVTLNKNVINKVMEDKYRESVVIVLGDVTTDEEYVYEDYLCAVDFIINSYTESHTDGIYKPEFKNEEASMEINLPVKIEDKDKLFVYSYTFGDSSRKTKKFIYDEGDNTIKVNFSSDEFTIAVYYDVSPYNGIYEEDVSERKNGYTVLVIIAVSVAIMIGLGAYAGKKRQ